MINKCNAVCSALTVSELGVLHARSSTGCSRPRARLACSHCQQGGNEIERYELSSNSTRDDLIPIALAVHALLSGLPVTMRSQNHRGVQIEEGKVKSLHYTGPVLEQVLAENTVIKTRPQSGEYVKVPVVVAPIQDSSGAAIAAIGVVDVTGVLDLADLMSRQSQIISQMRYCPVPASK